MSDLHTATIIADADLADDNEIPVRKSGAAGLWRLTLAKIKLYLSTAHVLVPAGGAAGQALIKNSAADNDLAWGSVASGGGTTTTQVLARYWRIRMLALRTDNSTTAASGLGELVFKNASGVSLISGGTAIASSSQGTNVPANAFDGTNATAWYTANGRNIGEWIGYDFGSAKAVASFSVTADPGFPPGMPLQFALDYSSDATEWFNHSAYTSAAWVANVAQNFNVPALTIAGTSASLYPVTSLPAGLTTWVNQGGATLTNNSDGSVSLSAANDATDQWRGVFMPLPATPWSYTIGFTADFSGVNYQNVGIALRESSSGKLVVIAAYRDGPGGSGPLFFLANYNSPSSKNANIVIPGRIDTCGPFFLNISDDGTTRKAYFGYDKNKQKLVAYSVAHNSFIVPDQIGIVVNNLNATYPLDSTFFYWQ